MYVWRSLPNSENIERPSTVEANQRTAENVNLCQAETLQSLIHPGTGQQQKVSESSEQAAQEKFETKRWVSALRKCKQEDQGNCRCVLPSVRQANGTD